MLHHTTVEGLKTLRLPAMASGLLEQREHPDYAALSFEDRLGLLVDRELLQRENRRLERVLKLAKLRSRGVIEDIDFTSTRGLDKATFLSMVDSKWVQHHHNVIIVGPTGVGKTFIACALAHRAIRDGHRAIYVRVPRLLDDLALARADGRLAKVMSSLARCDVLLLDDFLIRSLTDDQAADLLEVVEDRTTTSTIVTSQLPVIHWHEGLGDPTVADAILDRLLERAHRVELVGESRRRTKITTAAKRDSSLTSRNTAKR
ncbi:MAG TPA: IS21-like element helper ATPase IstB [Acidimicrobiales bacterium]|jgi:DNA replication protein DnaC|nr:IS21-like element helper ATPase IstB [Acidimicrobiales bacterium]